MFKYAVSNWIYSGEELEVTCKRLKRAGLDGIELVGEPQRYDTAKAASLFESCGLEVISVLCWCIWPMEDRDLAHADPEMRRKAVAYVCENVDLAAAVGAPIVVVIPAPSGRTSPHRASGDDAAAWQRAAAEEWSLAVEAVREAAQYATRKDIIIAVEPINRFETFLVNSAAQGIRFINDVGLPNVKLHLDTFHMHIEEADIAGAVAESSGCLVNMHLSDSNRRAVGRGHFDFGKLLASLKRINYSGALVLEPLPPHPNPFVAGRLPEFQAGWDGDLEDSIRCLKQLEKNV